MSSNPNGPSIKASIPEPPPLREGVEVTPLLLEWLERVNMNEKVIHLIKERHLYGLNKYGQGLMTEDGRNTLEDARQEAGDLLQYLFKARLQKTSFSSEEKKSFKEMLNFCILLIDFFDS